jgi:hypothetical protein
MDYNHSLSTELVLNTRTLSATGKKPHYGQRTTQLAMRRAGLKPPPARQRGVADSVQPPLTAFDLITPAHPHPGAAQYYESPAALSDTKKSWASSRLRATCATCASVSATFCIWRPTWLARRLFNAPTRACW